MSTKKLLPIVTILMVIALATVGVAYGMWTETLTINGNVATGNLNAAFYGPSYWDYEWPNDVGDCLATVSPDGQNLTITISNAYPGFVCDGGASILNLGTIPVKVHDWPETTTVPYLTVTLHDTSMAVVPDGGAFVIDPDAVPPYTIYGGVAFHFDMPLAVTDHQSQTYTFTYTLFAEQAVP